MRSAERLDRLERLAERPLMALALAMLPAILLPPILGDGLPRPAERVLDIVDWTVWGAFAAVFLAKVAVAPQRWRYVRTHPVELLIVAMPFLRPLRLLRLLAVVGLNVTLIARFFEKRGMRLLILGLAATMIAGAILVWAMERHAPEPWATATIRPRPAAAGSSRA